MHVASEPLRGELELIRRIREELSASPAAPGSQEARRAEAAVPFGDDMASLAAESPWVWTTDMLMEGVDFRSAEHGWRQIGRKAMGVNLSDCAAMAVSPRSALLAVALNNALSMEDALELVRGARDLAGRFGCRVMGGDTNSWDAPTVISVTLAALPPAGQRPVLRSGARPGDGIWLTGPVGGSILGRHLTFEPRIETAWGLSAESPIHAMIDISDGLARDLSHILDASKCGAVLDERRLAAAIHADAFALGASTGRPPLEHALYDGEDFELILTLPSDVSPALCGRFQLLPIGRIVAGAGVQIEGAHGTLRSLPILGWEHFR